MSFDPSTNTPLEKRSEHREEAPSAVKSKQPKAVDTKVAWHNAKKAIVGGQSVDLPLSPFGPKVFPVKDGWIQPHEYVHCSMGDDRVVYNLIEGAHDAEQLYKLAIASFNTENWSRSQSKALQRWHSLMEVWKPSGDWMGRRLALDAAPMRYAMNLLSDIFFLGGLQDRYDVIFRQDLMAQRELVGLCRLGKRGGCRCAYIEIEPTNQSKWTGDKDHRSYILSTLLHEATHAFLQIYACRGRECQVPECVEYNKEMLGTTGHGKAWLMLAYAIQKTAAKYMGFKPVIGLCSSTCHETSESGYVPGDDEFEMVFATSSQQQEPGRAEMMEQRVEAEVMRRGEKKWATSFDFFNKQRGET